MKKTPQKTDHLVTRRQFIGGAALSTAAFMVVPGSVLGLTERGHRVVIRRLLPAE